MAPPLTGKNGKVTLVLSQATQDLEGPWRSLDWLRALSLER
jgi:hypothetical protein